MTSVERQGVRRVVTGCDETGRSRIVADSICERQKTEEQYVSLDLWESGIPAQVDGPIDIPAEADQDPAAGGLVWRRFTLGAGEEIDYHTTETVDLMTVQSGTIILQMEDGEPVELHPGDCIVQRGTRHGWRNPGAQPCTLIGFMISTRPAQ